VIVLLQIGQHRHEFLCLFHGHVVHAGARIDNVVPYIQCLGSVAELDPEGAHDRDQLLYRFGFELIIVKFCLVIHSEYVDNGFIVGIVIVVIVALSSLFLSLGCTLLTNKNSLIMYNYFICAKLSFYSLGFLVK
jgi:hypothetical protein